MDEADEVDEVAELASERLRSEGGGGVGFPDSPRVSSSFLLNKRFQTLMRVSLGVG